MAKADLSAQRLRELLHYDAETGIFTHRINRKGGARAGDVAGHVRDGGYVIIGVECDDLYAHRLAWLYVHGKWPDNVIDHIDGNPTNNRLANLRDVPHRINCENKRGPYKKKKMPCPIGVTYFERTGRWMSQIHAHGKRIYLGYYDTPEEAHQVYLRAKRLLHEGCTI